jgi:nicotinamidase/pyrazinamidase
MRALIVADPQYDFCPGGALAVPHGDETIEVANRVMPSFDLVVVTQDWHPADHKSFAVNNPGTRPGDVIELAGQPQVMWPEHCVQDTYGAEIHAGLDRSRITERFQKGTDREIDGYSAFFDNGRRRSTGLAEFLKARGVDQVYVMGLATDYCVRYTALDARELGFDVFVIEDGCRAIDLHPGDGQRALDEMREAGCTIVRSDSVIA